MRKFIGVGGALLASLALAACGQSGALPEPTAVPALERQALSGTRLNSLQKETFESVAAADSSLDVEKLGERAIGPFYTQREAEYKLKGILADAYGIDNLSQAPSQTAITEGESFPRFAVSIMDAPKGSNLQTIDVFAQVEARQNWGLWGVMSILPGATVPGLTLGKNGATSIAKDAGTDLVASPENVLNGYVQLNQTRQESGGLTFADDTLRANLASGQDSNVQAVAGAADVVMNFEAGSEGPLSIATEDGGALVFGQMNFNTQIKVTKAGAKVNLKSTIGALGTGNAAGDLEVTGTMTASYTVLVAFHVPAAGSENPGINVVGASDPVLLSVENG